MNLGKDPVAWLFFAGRALDVLCLIALFIRVVTK